MIFLCSIFGFNTIVSPPLIARFVDVMRHRGPDYESVTSVSTWTLGHQRLSIIDRTSEANQPMSLNENVLAFNGEIYNYLELSATHLSHEPLLTHSDTEVLLRCLNKYGVSILNELNGMFAFSWFDSTRNKLILCRDRYGVKPLHWTRQGRNVYFSSEIKPLVGIAHSEEFESQVIDAFVNDTATDFDEKTFLKGIYQVPPGNYLEVDSQGNVKLVRWYHGADFSVDEACFKDENTLIDYYEDILSDSIRMRLRSDVPVCITLSGGLDSSVIYTLAKENFSSAIKPFTFMHPGAETDESEKVGKLVGRYGDTFCGIHASENEDFHEIMSALDILEFPIWNPSAIGYLKTYKAIKDSGFTVVIEGHGADEQLGGYPYMVHAACNDYIKAGNFCKAFDVYSVARATENPALNQRASGIKHILKFLLMVARVLGRQANGLEFMLDDAFHYKILPIVLRAFDRLTMSQSLESRAPFMDYRIVELNRRLPIEQKVSAIGSKSILRRLLKRRGLDFIYKDQAKMGFASDLPKLFNNPKNIKYLNSVVGKFHDSRYVDLKAKAVHALAKNTITWTDTEAIWKCFALEWVRSRYKS